MAIDLDTFLAALYTIVDICPMWINCGVGGVGGGYLGA